MECKKKKKALLERTQTISKGHWNVKSKCEIRRRFPLTFIILHRDQDYIKVLNNQMHVMLENDINGHSFNKGLWILVKYVSAVYGHMIPFELSWKYSIWTHRKTSVNNLLSIIKFSEHEFCQTHSLKNLCGFDCHVISYLSIF